MGYAARPVFPFRQRNYYEHVIRDQDEMNRARAYIAENPSRWEEDPENLSAFLPGAIRLP
ncbi:MAG: hypothetical protein QME71_01310 [Dehalococcoidia bacterium]|nr:hypothetical protein [Dehalococcoidia bacterium]